MAAATKPTTTLKTSLTHFFPPKPTFTDQNIPNNLSGKVYIVTGANSGMGHELARILYARNAKVYAACRSQEKAQQAITAIKKSSPQSQGELIFLPLDLADLTQIKTAATTFLSHESKLHILFNNAGVMGPTGKTPPKTTQGHELTLGVNCVGTFLFTKLLTPLLASTAKSEPTPGAVRVVWLSSYGLENYAPFEQGIDMSNLDYTIPREGIDRYGVSKCGVWLLAVEYGRRFKDDGIVSVPINPGNLRTALARDQSVVLKAFAHAIVYSAVHGVYTQLFAGFSEDVEIGKVDWTRDWGRFCLLSF